MNASTLLKVGLTGWALATTWVIPVAAATDCVSALRIEAPGATATQLRARLQAGRLATVSAEHCRDAGVYLEEKSGVWQLQFTQGSSTILRNVKSPEIAAVWVESWLMPTTFVDVDESPSHPPTATDELVDSSTGANGVGALSPEGSLTMTAALGSLWLGPDLRLRQPIGGGWAIAPRVGLAYAVTNRPEQASRALRFSTTVTRELLQTRNFSLDVGVDIGLTTLLWRDRRVARHVAGPHLGAQVGMSYAVSRRIALVGRVEAALVLADRVESLRRRVYFDNDDDAERVDIVTNEQRLEPTWVGVLGVGLEIHLGDLQ